MGRVARAEFPGPTGELGSLDGGGPVVRATALKQNHSSRRRFWLMRVHLPPPNRRSRLARRFPTVAKPEAQRRGRPARGARMWTLPWRRAPARAGASPVNGGLLGPRLVLGQVSTNEWMGLSCRTPPPPRPFAPCFFLEWSALARGRDYRATRCRH